MLPTAKSPGMAKKNTYNIITAGALSGDPAAICLAYSGGGFTDWYLPAIHDLSTLGDNLYLLNKTLESEHDPSSTPLNFGNSFFTALLPK
jgi:hypothetical protein